MDRVAIALGSNLGDRRAHLDFAVARLSQSFANLKVSSYHETGLEAAEAVWAVAPEELDRFANARHPEDDDFVQPGALYRETMDEAERGRLVENVVAHAGEEVGEDVQMRVVDYWTQVDSVLGARVDAGLRANSP